ncbi:hypothetical protein MUY27_16605 [Mucilaginibacter sp. RS28]|uniref:Uncharacterized protein n=1 Tax=Mucilaginibacter straminoryzae TaxID=2932774 RepID=A0A9X1X696_9SPHI|nr:hypothetical protein [Mucilaginibacter straminoryzae]MCJ8211341.1 hypothetical protein [Mucilaginibacter straminoryzae]
MRNLLIGLKILFMMCLAFPAHAQKAYDVFTYKAMISGTIARLELADGYLLASKVTLHSRSGDKIYAPTANEPNAAGELKFDLVKGTGHYKDDKGSWLLLKGLKPEGNSNKISAVFWNRKMQKAIVFREVN